MNSDAKVPEDSEVDALLEHRDSLIRRLALEVRRLRNGIRRHQAQTGHSLCWLNDVELWRLLQADADYPHDTLPVREEFMENCKRFYASRLQGTPWQDPPVKKTVVE